MHALVALVLFASPARADVVMPPPDDCPAGTTPATSHTGPHCVLAPPCDEAACSAGERCAPVRLCQTQVACGGWSVGNPDCHETHVTAGPECAGTWIEHPACAAEVAAETSTETTETTETETAPATVPERGGGCAHCTVGRASPPGAALVVLALALAARRLRRQAR